MRLSRFVQLTLTAGLFALAMASGPAAYAACNYNCEQTYCVPRFDNCVERNGGWTPECQQLYDNCAVRCGC